jgi:hypothetical protein
MRSVTAVAIVLVAVQTGSVISKDRAIELARRALADKTGQPVERIVERSATEVEWPDAGLGCGDPGKMYAQVVTRGYRVVLSDGARVYRVHASATHAVVCGEGLAPKEAIPPAGRPLDDRDRPIPEPADAASRTLVAGARQDLATRLSVAADRIVLLELTQVTWPDRSLGCPVPGVAYPQVTVDGVRIRLGADDRSYEYHAGGSRDPFLCEAPKR